MKTTLSEAERGFEMLDRRVSLLRGVPHLRS
jgi:hypothetical protein